MIRNLLWDIDGVLFDTSPAVVYTISKALSQFGHPVALNVIENLGCVSIDTSVETIAAHFHLDPVAVRSLAEEIYRKIPAANLSEMPGARSLCEWAKRHGGRNLILTNYPADIAVAFLRAHSMEDLIEGIFSIDQGYLPKPAPAMILAALGRYGLEADETLLIGNRRIDIEAAMNAGVHTCLIGKAALTGNAEFRIQSYGFLLDRLAEMQIDSHSLSNACLFLPPQSTLFLNPSARPYCPGIAIVAARCDI